MRILINALPLLFPPGWRPGNLARLAPKWSGLDEDEDEDEDEDDGDGDGDDDDGDGDGDDDGDGNGDGDGDDDDDDDDADLAQKLAPNKISHESHGSLWTRCRIFLLNFTLKAWFHS